MRTNVSLILFYILLSFTSCIKEVIPHLEKYDELLVVEGAITDEPGPHTVKLSIAGNLQKLSPYKPYSKCSVSIVDNFGNTEALTEVSEGVYRTDSLGHQGVVGRTYKVKILTPGGEVYESHGEVLKQGVAIDTVYAIHEQKNGRNGYQFYLNSENSNADTNYFFWSLESTYKFLTTYNINFYYEGGGVIKKFPKPDSLRTCFRTEKIKEIFTLNTAEQNQHQVIRFPLNYEDTYTKALSIRYCLTINQYTLSKRAYTFWNTLRKMNLNQGSLFAQQPYQVKGNIVNVNTPHRPALGYFMVAGVSQKRIFVDHLPYNLYHIPECTYMRHNVGNDHILNRVTRSAHPRPIYIAPDSTIPLSGEIRWGVMVGVEIDEECVDCRVTGYLQKPDFWID